MNPDKALPTCAGHTFRLSLGLRRSRRRPVSLPRLWHASGLASSGVKPTICSCGKDLSFERASSAAGAGRKTAFNLRKRGSCACRARPVGERVTLAAAAEAGGTDCCWALCKARDNNCCAAVVLPTVVMSSPDTRLAWPGSQAQKPANLAMLKSWVPAVTRWPPSTEHDTPAVSTAHLNAVLTCIKLQRLLMVQLSGSCCKTICSTAAPA